MRREAALAEGANHAVPVAATKRRSLVRARVLASSGSKENILPRPPALPPASVLLLSVINRYLLVLSPATHTTHFRQRFRV